MYSKLITMCTNFTLFNLSVLYPITGLKYDAFLNYIGVSTLKAGNLVDTEMLIERHSLKSFHNRSTKEFVVFI